MYTRSSVHGHPWKDRFSRPCYHPQGSQTCPAVSVSCARETSICYETGIAYHEKLGVIEPSSSEWSSPIVLVPKKDGTLRFCLDFRKLNSVSKFDPYPMPRVDELVERLGRANYLSTLDLCKGYWQVPLNPACKEFTAFRTPYGHFQFRVLPFGLHGAAATFQRMMDQVLRGTEDYAAAYLDDIIIFSQSWEEHLEHLKEVLTRIKAAGLTIRPDKCALAKPETQYLGFVLGHGVIRPQVGKLEAIKAAGRPETKNRLELFLDLLVGTGNLFQISQPGQ